MKIRRSGGQRFHKWTTLVNGTFENQGAHVKWDNKQTALVIETRSVPHPNDNKSTYDYEVILDLDDFGNLIKWLVFSGLEESPRDIARALNQHSIDLLRLLAAANYLYSEDFISMELKEIERRNAK